MAISSEACVLTPRKCFAEKGKNVRKWLEKRINFAALFVLAYIILASDIIIFWLFLYLKESLVAIFSKKCAHTSRKYLTEQGIGVALLCFYFRILPSKIVNHEVFLPIEEFPVANFCKSRAVIPRKYMVDQGIKVFDWSEILKSLWSHSSFLIWGK